MFPKEDDFYRFLNLHNKYSPDKKLEWNIGYNYTPESLIGLKLAVRF